MKHILLLIGIVFLLSNCRPNGSYEVVYVNGQPSSVYVMRPDGTQFLMDYLLYTQLMNQGGHTSVHNYYNTHQSDPYFQTQQSTYRTQYDQQQEYKRQQAAYERTQTQTKQSDGFGAKATNTQPSNGFGAKATETQQSTGFGEKSNNYPGVDRSTTTTKPSGGFGAPRTSAPSAPAYTPSKPSSGFGRPNTTTASPAKPATNTSKSNGFGKKQ